MDDIISASKAARLLGISNGYIYCLVANNLQAIKNEHVICINDNPIPFIVYDRSCLDNPRQLPSSFLFYKNEILHYLSMQIEGLKKVKTQIPLAGNPNLYKSIKEAYRFIHDGSF